MSEPKYGEPWRVDPRADRKSSNVYAGSVADAREGGHSYIGSRLIGEIKEFFSPNAAKRIVACVNLLAQVPDDSQAFSPRKSDEVQLALAVLTGDMGAAAALADELINKYTPTEPPVSVKKGLGYYETLGEYLLEEYKITSPVNQDFRGIQAATTQVPVLRYFLGACHRKIQMYHAGYPDRDRLYMNFTAAACKAVLESREVRTYMNQSFPPRMEPGAFSLYGTRCTGAVADIPGVPDIVVGYNDRYNSPTHCILIQDAFR